MSYLVQESDGTSKITLEDGSGFVLLELSVSVTGVGQLDLDSMIAIASDDMGSFIAMASEDEGSFIAVDSFNLEEMKVLTDG